MNRGVGVYKWSKNFNISMLELLTWGREGSKSGELMPTSFMYGPISFLVMYFQYILMFCFSFWSFRPLRKIVGDLSIGDKLPTIFLIEGGIYYISKYGCRYSNYLYEMIFCSFSINLRQSHQIRLEPYGNIKNWYLKPFETKYFHSYQFQSTFNPPTIFAWCQIEQKFWKIVTF